MGFFGRLCANSKSLVFASLVFVLASCGGGSDGGASSSDAASSDTTAGASSSYSSNAISDKPGFTFINIPIILSVSTGLELTSSNPTAADSFVMTLANCASGLSGTNSSPTTVKVYLNDTSCIVKLTSFVLNSESFTPTTNFTTWLVNDTAVFTGATSGNKVSLKVTNQLSSPIVNTDSVGYLFTVISASSTSTIIPSSQSGSLSVTGIHAPDFVINSGNAIWNGLQTSGGHTGYGIFSFTLTCSSGIMTVGANPSYNSFCSTTTGSNDGVDIGVANYFSYKLINDASGVGTLTLSAAQAAFTAGGDSAVTLSTDILANSSGFKITNIDGPGPAQSNPKMLLVLQRKNPNHPGDSTYSSFQYFPITVQTITP